MAYGAMMALAPDTGIDTCPCCEDVVPMGLVELGTSASHPSSSCESTSPSAEYQVPACVALRRVMLVERVWDSRLEA